MSGQIVGYVRVSSIEENPARQLAAIGTVDEIFTDRVSGKSRSERPELARMAAPRPSR
jgi:DNA invertase Pin-like site-specific DNA recombinase